MKQLLFTLLVLVAALQGQAQEREILKLSPARLSQPLKVEDQDEFIFNPEGDERMYVMTLYSYDQSNSKFVRAVSLKSQIRYAADGKTVYLKDLTKSLGTLTWLQGERRVMEKDSLEVGIHQGDTVLQVPFGQSLVYYQGKYLVFFAPMLYNDATGNMEAQDNYTLIQRGDSLVQPTLPEGVFQAAAGYVIITESKQGCLSLDIDHNMRLERTPLVEAPADIEPVEYVYSFTNSYGNIYKKKVNVKRQGNDLYMQLSTSAPNAYVHGTLHDGEIAVESGQVITDSTFIYYYSLADPVYEAGELSDFVPTSERRLAWDEATRSISPLHIGGDASIPVFSVDYMDGMLMCRDYVSDPYLTVYPGDAPATPANPIWRSVNLGTELIGSFTDNYMSFVIPALDVDSNYINPSHLTYRVYLNDSLFHFTPSVYKNLSEEMTDVSCTFADGYDFYTYDQLHYIYLYMTEKDVQSLGIQSVYTVNGIERRSEIVTKYFSNIDDGDTLRLDHDLALTACHLRDNVVRPGEKVSILGTVTNQGRNAMQDYVVTLTTAGQTTTYPVSVKLEPGKTNNFQVDYNVTSCAQEGQAVEMLVTITPADESQADENTADNSLTLHYGTYSQALTTPRLLIEEFTAESCGWCPYGAYRIHTAIEESGMQDQAIWMCHHEGYGMDWLTVDASTDYTALYGGNTFAPAWMVNRNQKYGDEAFPVFSIPDVSEVAQVLTTAREDACFVEVEAESTCHDGTLSIRVSAHKSLPFDVQCPQARLTVFLVEDSIASKKQKTYDSHTIPYHHNALRAVLTEVWGDNIQWNGDQMEMTYTFQVPEEYVLKNLGVIALVHEMNDDVCQRRIYNTAFAPAAPQADGIIATTVREEQPRYNLMGQRVTRPSHGVVITGGRKLLVR